MSTETDPTLERLATGAAGERLLTLDLPGAGEVCVDVLDPVADLELLHTWVTRPSSRFWGLGDLDRTALGELYAFVDGLHTHHAFIIRWQGVPVVLLQTYAPDHDAVGEAYDVEPGDIGLHFLLGDRGPGPAPVWHVLGAVLHAFVADQPGVERVLVEPDARNVAAVRRVRALGFALGDVVTFDAPSGPKTAQLAFLSREGASALGARSREALRAYS